MAYTPREMTNGVRTTIADTLQEETRLRWDGWVPTSNAQPPAPTLEQLFSSHERDALRAAFGRAELLGRARELPRPAEANAVMANPPTVGAIAGATAIVGSVWLPSTEGGVVAADRFTYFGAGEFEPVGAVFPDSQMVRSVSVTTTTSATAPYSVEFWFDGTTLEINTKGITGRFTLRVDDQLVSAAPVVVAQDGAVKFIPVTFATRAWRRVTFESSGLVFGGVRIGPNDTVLPVDVRGPRVIVIGDSFTEGTGSDGSTLSWSRKMGRLLGWRDLWASGSGGTGYVATGVAGRVKFRDRIQSDVIDHEPDVVVWAGGINDPTGAPATVGSEAQLCYEAVAAALPNTVQIVLSPFWRGGPETFPSGLLEVRDAIRAAAAAVSTDLNPVHFIDLLEIPLSAAPIQGALTSAIANGATSFVTNVIIARGSVVEIGADSGSARIRRSITNITGSGPFTHTVVGAMTPFASGTPIRQVGRGLWTGSGRVGATTGSGNSDLLVGNDNTHPTQAGHDAIAAAVASGIASRVLAR